MCVVYREWGGGGGAGIRWFVLTQELSARLQITRKCICPAGQTVEKKYSRQTYKQILALKDREGILSEQFFFWSVEEGFKFRTVR